MTSALEGVGLVLSNVAIFPAIYYAYYRGLFVEMAISISVFIASTSFHICQVDWFCWGVSLHALQITDHFVVYTAVFWFSLYWAGAAERTRAALTLGLMAVLLPVIITHLGSWIPLAAVAALTITMTLGIVVLVVYIKGRLLIAWKPMAIASVLLVAGVVLHVFGGDFENGNQKYPVAHSVWHALSMLSLLFVLKVPFKDVSITHDLCTDGDHSRTDVKDNVKDSVRDNVKDSVKDNVRDSVGDKSKNVVTPGAQLNNYYTKKERRERRRDLAKGNDITHTFIDMAALEEDMI